MNQKGYLDYHKEMCDKARDLSFKKNCDYAGKQGKDPFANFNRCHQLGICSTEKGFLVRLTDKFSRLSTFCSGGTFEVADESFEDTCLDIINYVCLMAAYVKDKRSNSNAIREKQNKIFEGGNQDGEGLHRAEFGSATIMDGNRSSFVKG
jgi:hypothetical protein|tara:strand:- start:1870 stop:2319 length:450 start_codon:yes stop_codon:yes gene_type:complete